MRIKEIGLEAWDQIHLAQVAGTCEHGNELPGFIESAKFLDLFPKKDADPWR
jgi:hypothetical protein